MKRIVTCPKCEAKLAIFDLGKPINQKCPKCGNAFVIESEEKKEPAKSEDAAVGSVKPENGRDKKNDASSGDVKPADADVKAAGSAAQKEKAADKPDGQATDQKEAAPKNTAGAEKPADPSPDKKEPAAKEKEITLKKPVQRSGGTDKPVLPTRPGSAAPSALDEVAPQTAPGPSPIFSMVVMGLLILVIVMQIMMKLRADKQYKTLIDHLQYIEKNMK